MTSLHWRVFRPAGLLFVLLAIPSNLPAMNDNPCREIPENRRPPLGFTFDPAVEGEWKKIKTTLGEISELHQGAHSEESTQLKYNLNRLPGAGPIAFKGRLGVQSTMFIYFPAGKLACVVTQSKSRPGGSLWDRAFFLLPVEQALRPALEYRGPGKSPFQAFERLDLKEQLGYLRQLHRNLRAARSYMERRRAAASGKNQRKDDWSLR